MAPENSACPRPGLIVGVMDGSNSVGCSVTSLMVFMAFAGPRVPRNFSEVSTPASAKLVVQYSTMP